jgi:hypothetical protein
MIGILKETNAIDTEETTASFNPTFSEIISAKSLAGIDEV